MATRLLQLVRYFQPKKGIKRYSSPFSAGSWWIDPLKPNNKKDIHTAVCAQQAFTRSLTHAPKGSGNQRFTNCAVAMGKKRIGTLFGCLILNGPPSTRNGCGSKNRYQNGTLVSGNMDQHLRNPCCLILSHTQMGKRGCH